MSFSPISTIKKVWKELEEEDRLKNQPSLKDQPPKETNQITFSPSALDNSNKQHYMNYERRSTLERLKRSMDGKSNPAKRIKGSPRVVKINTELKEMKSYMNGMLKRRALSDISLPHLTKRKGVNVPEVHNAKAFRSTNKEIRRLQRNDLADSSMESIDDLVRKRVPPGSKSVTSEAPLFNLPSSPLQKVMEDGRDAGSLKKENDNLKKRVDMLEKMLHQTEEKLCQLETKVAESSILRSESFERVDSSLEVTKEKDLLHLSPAKVNLSFYR